MATLPVLDWSYVNTTIFIRDDLISPNYTSVSNHLALGVKRLTICPPHVVCFPMTI
jgi:hypothetical protein